MFPVNGKHPNPDSAEFTDLRYAAFVSSPFYRVMNPFSAPLPVAAFQNSEFTSDVLTVYGVI
jgi:hypothetical protein